MDQKPSIGRVVHFVNQLGEHCAATVAHVWSDTCVNLGYLDHNGVAKSETSVTYDGAGIATNSWHWPERV